MNTTARESAPGDASRRPTYRFSAWFVCEWLLSAAAGLPRNLGADAVRLSLGRSPAPAILDAHYVPGSGPFILVMNHYERRNLRVWWPAALVSATVWQRRREVPAVRWLISDRFHHYRLGPLLVPDRLVRWLLLLIARRYGLILVPRDESARGGRAAALAEAERALRAAAGAARPVGVTPETGGPSGSELAEAWRNAGTALAWLSRGEIPIVPVAVYEDADGALVARFGVPFSLPWPGLRAARRSGPDLARQVMSRLAELLPSALRGPYAATTDPPADAGG